MENNQKISEQETQSVSAQTQTSTESTAKTKVQTVTSEYGWCTIVCYVAMAMALAGLAHELDIPSSGKGGRILSILSWIPEWLTTILDAASWALIWYALAGIAKHFKISHNVFIALMVIWLFMGIINLVSGFEEESVICAIFGGLAILPSMILCIIGGIKLFDKVSKRAGIALFLFPVLFVVLLIATMIDETAGAVVNAFYPILILYILKDFFNSDTELPNK